MITWLRYVTHDAVPEYLAKGWVVSCDLSPTHHGEYAILMQAGGAAWLPVVGYEGLYEACIDGRVRSLDRWMTSETSRRGYPRWMRGRELRQQAKSTGGYHTVTLHRPDGKVERVHVAHLVAAAWHGPRPHRHEVCHTDGDRKNNHARNLRYATHAENEADKIMHGTKAVGSKLPQSKLTESTVREIRRRAVHETSKEIAATYGVSVNTIDFVIHRRAWGHLPVGPGEVGTPDADAARHAAKKARYAAHARSINPHARHSHGEPK